MSDPNNPLTPLSPLDALASGSTTTPPPIEPAPASSAQADLNNALSGIAPASSTPPQVEVTSAFTSEPMPIPTSELPPAEIPPAPALNVTEHPIDISPPPMPIPSADNKLPPPPSSVPQEMTGLPLPQADKDALEAKAESIINDKSVGNPPIPKGNGPSIKKISAIGGGLVALAIAVVGVLAGTGAMNIPGITSTSGHACTWVVTNCGAGCADNKDLYNCGNVGTPYVAPGTVGNNPDSDQKAINVAPGEVLEQMGIPTPAPNNTTTTSTSTNQGSGGYTTCSSDSNCSDGLKCWNGSCSKTIPCGQQCPEGYTTLPQSGCDVNLVNQWCIKGTPSTVDATSGTCSVGQRSACGANGCGSNEQKICWGGSDGWGGCIKSDGCAPQQEQGASCAGLSQYSAGEPSNGAFVGCNGNQNCFCDTSGGNLIGTVRCITDAGGDSCGAKSTTTTTTTTFNATTTDDTPPPPLPPEQSLICVDLTSTASAPKINDTVTFTCNATAANLTISTYEFRYKIDDRTWSDLTQVASSSKQSRPLTVTDSGVYSIQCRACTSTSICTPWSVAQ